MTDKQPTTYARIENDEIVITVDGVASKRLPLDRNKPYRDQIERYAASHTTRAESEEHVANLYSSNAARLYQIAEVLNSLKTLYPTTPPVAETSKSPIQELHDAIEQAAVVFHNQSKTPVSMDVDLDALDGPYKITLTFG